MTGSGHVTLYQDKTMEWRWRRVAGNGKVVADSGESYLHRVDALAMAAELFPGLPVVTITEKQKDDDYEPVDRDPVEPQES